MSKTIITVRPNGSIKVDGDFSIVDGDGNAYEVDPDKPIWLCRCGASEKKPFCDSSHKKIGFCAEEGAVELNERLRSSNN